VTRLGGVQIAMMGAVVLAAILLVSDLPFVPDAMHSYLSAVPLAVVGFGYAALQMYLRPGGSTLLKRLMLAATFVLWAVDQLVAASRSATVIGDVVIAAYVMDLYWAMQDQAV
jgi:hypothetical protein